VKKRKVEVVVVKELVDLRDELDEVANDIAEVESDPASGIFPCFTCSKRWRCSQWAVIAGIRTLTTP
jgi:hypothetical protein